MSTDIDTAEETTSETEPANLVKLASQELHDRAAALTREADEALDADDWAGYTRLSEIESKFQAEIERRGDAARKIVPVAPVKAPPAAADKIEQTRQALAEAEKAFEAFAGVKPRGNTPPAWGQTASESDAPEVAKAEAFVNVENLKADLAAMEARIPFMGLTDEEVSVAEEDASIEKENLHRDLVTFTEEGRRAAAAKAERQLGEVTQRHYALMGENGVRKSERKKEALLDGMAERKAALHRTTALKDWTQRKDELETLLTREVRDGESIHYDMQPLREAPRPSRASRRPSPKTCRLPRPRSPPGEPSWRPPPPPSEVHSSRPTKGTRSWLKPRRALPSPPPRRAPRRPRSRRPRSSPIAVCTRTTHRPSPGPPRSPPRRSRSR